MAAPLSESVWSESKRSALLMSSIAGSNLTEISWQQTRSEAAQPFWIGQHRRPCANKIALWEPRVKWITGDSGGLDALKSICMALEAARFIYSARVQITLTRRERLQNTESTATMMSWHANWMPERLTQLTIAPFDIGEPEQSASASFDSDGKEKKRRTKDRRKKKQSKEKRRGKFKTKPNKNIEFLSDGRNGRIVIRSERSNGTNEPIPGRKREREKNGIYPSVSNELFIQLNIAVLCLEFIWQISTRQLSIQIPIKSTSIQTQIQVESIWCVLNWKDAPFFNSIQFNLARRTLVKQPHIILFWIRTASTSFHRLMRW